MNNLNIFESTFASFSRTSTPSSKLTNNCSNNCQAQIKNLPFWLNNKPFWTYQCKCCTDYQFLEGKVGGFDD